MCTLGYVIGYNIVFQQLYRQAGNVQGNVALDLQSPDPLYSLPAQDTSFCLYDGSGSSGQTVPGGPPFSRYPCQYLDAYDAVYPGTEAGALFLATRITRSEQALSDPGCQNLPRRNCSYVTSTNSSSYTADVEFFKLSIGHVMTAPDLDDARLSQSALDMADGCISTGETCQTGVVDPCSFYVSRGFVCPPDIAVGQPGRTDTIAVGTLLQAAGIYSLDEAAGEASHPGPLLQETLRNAGFTILVTVLYSNYYEQTHRFDQDTIVYRYKVSLVRNEAFSGTETLPGPGSGAPNRTLLERHGVRIVVKQAGTIGAFNVAVMLVSLTTSLSLIAIAKVVVDFMALYCLPLRHVYSQYMKVKTVDFSDMEALGPKVLDRFRTHDLVNAHPAVFGSVDKEGHIMHEGGEGGEEGGEAGAGTTNSASQGGWATAVAAQPSESGAWLPTGAAKSGRGADQRKPLLS